MNENGNTNIVQHVYEFFRGGDIKALLNLLSDDVEWQLPEIENVPFAGKRRGHEQMGQFFASLVDTQEMKPMRSKPPPLDSGRVKQMARYHSRLTGPRASSRKAFTLVTNNSVGGT